MALKTGTHGLADLLANNNTAASTDLGAVNEVMQADLAAHNAIVSDMVNEIAEPTTAQQLTSGASDSGEMVEMDEYGRPPTQKPTGVVTVGIPLRLFGHAVGWTRKYLQSATVADLARAQIGAQKAHRKRLLVDLKKSIFLAANYTFVDYLMQPPVSLAVKRFVNADSMAIPEGPNGEVFVASSHTHYSGNATLTAAVALAVINNVAEHGHMGRLRAVISVTDEAAWRALSGFVPYPDPRVQLGTGQVATQRLDITRSDNRAIGFFGLAEVWTKPWGIANYVVVYDADGPKPVAYRTRTPGGGGLGIVAENDAYPLRAEFMEAEFGFGVRTRTNGAILNYSNASYTDPTL